MAKIRSMMDLTVIQSNIILNILCEHGLSLWMLLMLILWWPVKTRLNEDPLVWMKTFRCKPKSHWSKSTLMISGRYTEQWRPTHLKETDKWLELRLRFLCQHGEAQANEQGSFSSSYNWQKRRQKGGIKPVPSQTQGIPNGERSRKHVRPRSMSS